MPKQIIRMIVYIIIIPTFIFPYASFATDETPIVSDPVVNETAQSSGNSTDQLAETNQTNVDLSNNETNNTQGEENGQDDQNQNTEQTQNETESLPTETNPNGIDIGELYTPVNTGVKKNSYSPMEIKETYGVDKATGSFNYTLGFPIPENVSSITPSVALFYDSSNSNDFTTIAHGWDVSMPKITLKNNRGTDQLYNVSGTQSSNCSYFTAQLPSGSFEFKEKYDQTNGCSIDSGTLAYKNDFSITGNNNANYKILFNYQAGSTNSGTFEVIDGNGTRYVFGTNNKQIKPNIPLNPINPSVIYDGAYEWLLDQVIDTHGNTITYNYHIEEGVAYPKQIVFGGSNSYEIRFSPFYEGTSVANERPDKRVSYNAGFKRYFKYQVNKISYVYDNIVKYYWDITYTKSNETNRYLLSSVHPYMSNGTGGFSALPETNLTYQQGDASPTAYNYSLEVMPETVTYGNNSRPARFIDINGDAYPDILYSHNSYNNSIYPHQNNNPISNRKSVYKNNTVWTRIPELTTQTTDGFTNITNQCNISQIPYFSTNKYLYLNSDNHEYGGYEYIDVDNDTVPEMSVGSNSQKIDWNTCTPSGQNGATNYLFSFFEGNYSSSGVNSVDLNGDNLLDFIHNQYYQGFSNNQEGFALNRENMSWGMTFGYRGTEMSWKQEYFNPVFNQNDYFREGGTRYMDVNADGLEDVVISYTLNNTAIRKTLLNNGSKFVETSLWQAPVPTFYDSGSTAGTQAVEIIDWNGDGYPDLVGYNALYINNTVNGWNFLYGGSGQWIYMFLNKLMVNGAYYQFGGSEHIDINADGLVDVLMGVHDTYDSDYLSPNTGNYNRKMYSLLHKYKLPDIMTNVSNGKGGSIALSYKPSSHYKEANGSLSNPNLPRVIQTVEQMTVDTGFGSPMTTTYQYKNGVWYFEDGPNSYDMAMRSEFAGFGLTKEVYGDGTYSVSYFHQGNGATGDEGIDDYRLLKTSYKTEMYSSTGSMLSTSYTRHNLISLNNGDVAIGSEYDISTKDSSSVAVGYTYDSFARVTEKTEYGKVNYNSSAGTFSDISGDTRTTKTGYALNESAHIIAYPSWQELYDWYVNRVARSEYFYDGFETLGNINIGDKTIEKEYDFITPSDRSTQYEYDSYGNVIQITRPNGAITVVEYDPIHHYFVTESNENGGSASPDLVTTYTWEYSFGHPLSVTAPTGLTAWYSYDGLGRALSYSVSDISSTETPVLKNTYVYRDTVIPQNTEVRTHIHVNNPSSYVRAITHRDGFGRTLESKQQFSPSSYVVTDTHYDEKGNTIYSSHPYFNSSDSFDTANWSTIRPGTTTTYDALTRPLTVATQTGTTSYAYNGFETIVTNPRGINSKTITDAYGNIMTLTEYNKEVEQNTIYRHDAKGLLVGFQDAEGNTRSFGYDGYGRRTYATELSGGFMEGGPGLVRAWHYAYDVNNNIISSTDPNGNVISYEYDILNRPTKESRNGIDYTTYFYGTDGLEIGKPIRIITPDIDIRYQYDTHGNIINEIKTIDNESYQSTAIYDHLDRLLTITLPDTLGTVVSYEYDDYGKLTSLIKDENIIISQVSYEPTGQVSNIVYGNGDTESFTRSANTDYRLTRKITTNTRGEVLQDISYSYDQNANITNIINKVDNLTAKKAEYIYDDLDRLESEHVVAGETDQSTRFSYSKTGNILTKGNTRFEYGMRQPQAVARMYKDDVLYKNFAYDNAGNMISETCEEEGFGCINKQFVYDPTLRMSAINTEKTVYSYTYDPSGERIASRAIKTDEPETYTENTIQINPMIDKDLLSGNENIYLSMNDTSIAHIARNNVQEPSSETLGYIHSDHLGGSSIITDIRGTIQVQRDYYPFGETRIDESLGTPDFNTKYQFTGQEKDEGTGLYYYHARYYHPEIGRFISVDPVARLTSSENYFTDPQQWNAYAYARNNPVKFVDPTGELTIALNGTQPLKKDCTDCGKESFDDIFIQQSAKDLNEKYAYTVLSWSGDNNPTARSEAAIGVANYINDYKFAEDEELNIIGFSHGGNVAIETINRGLKKSVDKLILLAVPVRDEYTIKNPSSVKNIYNVYDPKENVQGGFASIDYGLNVLGFVDFTKTGQKRSEKNAKNIEVNASANKIILPVLRGIVKHLNMHNTNVWNQFIKKSR